VNRIPLAALFAAAALATPAGAAPLTTSYASLSTEAAITVAQAALAECQRQGYVVAVAVLDRAGTPLAMLRDNLAGPHTPSTATNKAWTAVSFRTSSAEIAAMSEAGRAATGIRSLPNVVALGGGQMIRGKGVMLGAVGVSGAPSGTIDDACGSAGIAAIQDALELD